MSLNKIQLVCGILLIAMPFLGFPSGWKTLFYILVGICFIILSLQGHVERRSHDLISEQKGEES